MKLIASVSCEFGAKAFRRREELKLKTLYQYLELKG